MKEGVFQTVSDQTPVSGKGLAVVTGANGGMGSEICKCLLSAGYRVVAVCKPQNGGPEFVQQMNSQYPLPVGEAVRLLEMDLADFDQVRKAAATLNQWAEPIDLLLNNAGMLGWKPQISAQGYEMHYAVNCLSPILFTRLLKPLLHNGSRVINTISCTVWIGKIPYNFPQPSKRFNRFVRYSDSKYALLQYSLRLAKEWAPEGITVNMADPGIVNTPIIAMHNWIDPLTDLFFRPFIRQAPKGASTAVFLALDPSVAHTTGGMYANSRQKLLSKRMTTDFSLTLPNY